MERISVPPRLPRRRSDAHKGDFGRVLVVGGSRGMIGAPALAAQAALRGGAGLVTMAVPAEIQLTVAGLCPCATSVPLSTDAEGDWSPSAVRQMLRAAETADVLAVGPGLGVGPGREQLIRAILTQEKPVVLDADGLNNLARLEDWPARRRCAMILTPHPGEFARLLKTTPAAVQADRQAHALTALERWRNAGETPPLVLVLKGAGTMVTDGERLYVNATGNPGLATGGSGDVLTGLIAALVGQGMGLFEAACLGVYGHGRAGDLAVKQYTETGLIASDLPDFLPQALKETHGL